MDTEPFVVMTPLAVSWDTSAAVIPGDFSSTPVSLLEHPPQDIPVMVRV
jgi:2,3-bisphosphoglycerate-independent phosphoglycerate mutase